MDGAQALAIPVKLGQNMVLKDGRGSELNWKSHDSDGTVWFEAQYDLLGFDIMKTSDQELAEQLRKIIIAIVRQNSDFLSHWKKYTVNTFLDFNRKWGLGTSSTLIHCLAQWGDVNPFLLYFDLYDGSGYDVACAGSDGPIHYRFDGESIEINPVEFAPKFSDQLYFIYLNKKADTQAEVSAYHKNKKDKALIGKISKITEAITVCSSASKFHKLIVEHNNLLSKALSRLTVQEELFSDFPGAVKSLGAWGGDFVMAIDPKNPDQVKSYFEDKGYSTIFTLDQLAL
jgi:mevalonate kinase